MTKITQVQLDIPTDLYLKIKAIAKYENANWENVFMTFIEEGCDKYPDHILTK